MAQQQQVATPRQNNINWDKYFMGLAFLARHRSKNPYNQAGACIIDEDKKVVGIGYNGMPIGCDDDVMPTSKGTTLPSGHRLLDSRSYYECHAELNAIMFRNSAGLKGCTMYCTMYPCNECAKVIIQSGITHVIYFSDEKGEEDKYKAAKIMFKEAKIFPKEYEGDRTPIQLRFSTDNLGDM